VFFDRQLSHEFDYRCKQAGQLAAKMRFLSAPWAAMLEDGIWLKYAQQANQSAALLARKLATIPEVDILFPVQANAVFIHLPEHLLQALKRDGWACYEFIGGGLRLMCSWMTTVEDIDALHDCLKTAARLC